LTGNKKVTEKGKEQLEKNENYKNKNLKHKGI
jgi:hypothetical protein